MTGDSDRKLPLADDLDEAWLAAKAAGKDKILVEIPATAAVTIAIALRSYFGIGAPMHCFACGYARNSEIDTAIDNLRSEATRLSLLLMTIEDVVYTAAGKEPPTTDDVLRQTIKQDLRDARMNPRPRHTPIVSQELRAIVREWPEGSKEVKDQESTRLPPDESMP